MPTSAIGSKTRGFTLIETLLVLAVLAVMLAVLAPAMVPSSRTELHATARTIGADLRLARLDALRRQRETQWIVDTEQGVFGILGRSERHSLPEGATVLLTTAVCEVVDADTGGIRFFPDGSSTGGRVTLGHEGIVLHLDIEWLTGRTRLLEVHEG
ncbi:MAG: GspH/FimT family pseudopilin [Sedimenticola sp.]